MNRTQELILTLQQAGKLPSFQQWLTKQVPQKVIPLFQELVSLGTHKFSYKDVAQALYPHSSFKDIESALKQQFYLLRKALNTFLIQNQVQNLPYQSGIALAQSYEELGANDNLKLSYKQSLKGLYKKAVLSAADHLFRFQLEDVLHRHTIKHQLPRGTHLQEQINALDRFWLTEQFYQACLTQSRTLITGESFSLPLLPMAVAHVETNPEIIQPAAGFLFLYYQLYLLFTGNQTNVQLIWEYVLENWDELEMIRIREIFDLTQNYYIYQMNNGYFEKWAPHLMDHLEWGVVHGPLLRDGTLPPQHYRNMIVVCMRMQAVERAKRCLEAWKKHLPAHGQEYHRYCQWYIYWQTGAFEKMGALFHPKKRFLNPSLELSARFGTLQALYEQYWQSYEPEEGDLIHKEFNRLKRYFRSRKHVGKGHTQAYENFLRLFGKLIHQIDRPSLLALQQEINEITLLANRNWFLKQIQERI